MKGQICPYDGATCTGNCLYQCPPKRVERHPRASLRAEWLVSALMAVLLLTAALAVVAHGAELDTDGRGKFARNAVARPGPCWIAMNSAALLDLRWQCTYWGRSE